jgi:hypothetical protein
VQTLLDKAVRAAVQVHSDVVLARPTIFRLRQRSLLRGILLSLGALAAAMGFAGFPHVKNLHSSPWLLLAVLAAAWAMAETVRCLGRRWSFYHAGVLLLLYSDLMILAMALFFWLYL